MRGGATAFSAKQRSSFVPDTEHYEWPEFRQQKSKSAIPKQVCAPFSTDEDNTCTALPNHRDYSNQQIRVGDDQTAPHLLRALVKKSSRWWILHRHR